MIHDNCYETDERNPDDDRLICKPDTEPEGWTVIGSEC